MAVTSTEQIYPNNIYVKESDIGQFLQNKLNIFANADFTFIFDINQRVDNKSRTFLEVLNNDGEYSEVIGYHLKKYNGNTADLIQEWYLPNTGETKFNWIDTQIKYNKSYTYKLDPIILTFATDYKILNVSQNANKIYINFSNKPAIKVYILRSDINNARTTIGATYTNKLLDYPPIEPEIELVPYIGVHNKIKINLNTSIGLKTVSAISFSPLEETINSEIRTAQNKDTNSDILTFQADEPSDFMEIYRIEFKPKTYNDFINNKIVTLQTNGSAGASYVDTIDSNKKYYYIARSLDYHRNTSNPTPIYELEIINDNGLIIPNIKIVDFDKGENNRQQIKSFKRYLKIQPSTTHRMVNTIKTNENDIQLGELDVTPWNKNFKVRITSKSTGRKLDVNFKFKYNKPK